MERKIAFSAILITALILSGCQSLGEKTKTGAVIGGLVGAGTGAIIGHQSGHGWGGAAIGAAAGAVGGGLIGNQMDQADKKAKSANPEHLSVVNIAEMASKGVPEDVIISEIQRTKSVYNLTTEIINYLKQNKVTDKVINYMLSTSS